MDNYHETTKVEVIVLSYNRRMPLPLLWVSLAFITGIPLAKLVSLPLTLWVILTIPSIITIVLLRRSRFFLPAISLLAIIIGAARYQSTVPTLSISHIAWFNDRNYDMLVTGTLVEPPDTRDTYTNLRLQVDKVDTSIDQIKVSGLLLARVQPNQTYH